MTYRKIPITYFYMLPPQYLRDIVFCFFNKGNKSYWIIYNNIRKTLSYM